MNSIYDFIITPKEGRYNNEVKIEDKTLIINANIEDHKLVSRHAIIKSIPLAYSFDLKEGDEVIIHHNIFRRWYDIRGNERNSRNYFTENLYFCPLEQIYLYKQNKEWITNLDYCFIKPVRETDKSKVEILKQQKGVLKYTNSILTQLDVHKEDVVGFNPMREWEFIIDGQLLYCMKSKDIVIKYDEYKGNETEYNPSWAQSS